MMNCPDRVGKMLAALFFLLLPVPVYARQLPRSSPELPLRSPGRAAKPFCSAGEGTAFRLGQKPLLPLLLPGCPDNQRTAQAPQASAQASTGKATGRTPQKPHLIELTSANWHPLTANEKLTLFDRDLLHWETHASLLLDAGIASAVGDREFLGTGARGYFSIYGLNVADELNFTFFNAYLFPTVFHQEPRYIPRDRGTKKQRLFYAVSRIVVTRSDTGKSEFNKSKVLGTILATSISSTYYAGCGAHVGIGGNFASIGINLASDAAFDILKEFWPDAARKMKLSFWIRNLVRASLRDQIRIG